MWYVCDVLCCMSVSFALKYNEIYLTFTVGSVYMCGVSSHVHGRPWSVYFGNHHIFCISLLSY